MKLHVTPKKTTHLLGVVLTQSWCNHEQLTGGAREATLSR